MVCMHRLNVTGYLPYLSETRQSHQPEHLGLLLLSSLRCSSLLTNAFHTDIFRLIKLLITNLLRRQICLVCFHLLWGQAFGLEQDVHVLKGNAVGFGDKEIHVNSTSHRHRSEEQECSVGDALEHICHGIGDVELAKPMRARGQNQTEGADAAREDFGGNNPGQVPTHSLSTLAFSNKYVIFVIIHVGRL